MRMRTTLDQAFPLLMKQLELMLTSGELNPAISISVDAVCEGADLRSRHPRQSGGYVYLAVYPTPETKR